MTFAARIATALRPLAPEGELRVEDVPLINQLAALWEKRSPRHDLDDPAAFFAAVRASLGPLTQSQVDGANALLEAMGKVRWPLAWVAYALATAWHETAKTMQPIKEHGGTAYFTRMYDIRGERPGKARELGNLTPGDGARYAGRGYVQLTGKRNYAMAGEELSLDLVANPDLAMECGAAASIMVKGMEQGWFTGKRLADYLPIAGGAGHEAFKQSRRIINGLDRADDIATLARRFQSALEAGRWG